MENQYRLAIISVLNKKKASFIEVTELNVLISEIACMLVPFGSCLSHLDAFAKIDLLGAHVVAI